MMLYTFVKDVSGNVQRVGAECSVPQELGEVLKVYSADGCQMAEAAEYDMQVIKGAEKGVEGVEDSKLMEEQLNQP